MRAPSSAVAGTRLSDHPEVPVSFDLEYESIMPAWGHAADGNVAGTHYEQNGLIRGRIRCAGETFDYDGIGFRDRIAGPKDTSLLAGHNWIHGTMRDGRAFALTQIRLKTDPRFPWVRPASLRTDMYTRLRLSKPRCGTALARDQKDSTSF